MSAAVPTSEAERVSAKRAGGGRSFFGLLVAISCSLVLLGGLGFGYLRANSPLGLFAGSEHPIAAATVFVPSRSPFTISLLAKPERLIALQQAVVAPAKREQARREIAQVQQTLFQLTGLDYERDIQPWAGEELTYAYVDADLDQSSANGQQPGYFLAVEIAPDRQLQAQSFLQLFWQQQSLSGNVPQSQKISGVRVLSGRDIAGTTGRRAATLSAATALVGNQFVLFANDVRVIRRSLRASQTAQNLAQNSAYRQAVDALPMQRIGLAYLDTSLLNGELDGEASRDATLEKKRGRREASRSALSSTFMAIGVGLTRTGLMANLSAAATTSPLPLAVKNAEGAGDKMAVSLLLEAAGALQYLPASSELAVVGNSLSALESTLLASGVPRGALPEFLQLGQSLPQNPWAQVTTHYALARLGSGRARSGKSSRDWILAVKREAATDPVAQALNQAATKAGYSVVPVSLGEEDSDRDATAWTRFKIGKRRQASSALETELLGLHLQRGDYEIYASSLAAMNSSLAAPSSSLLESPRFLQAIAPLETPNDGYLYVDWPAIAPSLGQAFPVIDAIDRAARPLSTHIRAVTATRYGEQASFFIQLKEAAS